jgi:hypothetical protein
MPLLACAVSCLLESPESWLNLLWISLEIVASSGFLAQPALETMIVASTTAASKGKTRAETRFMGRLLNG